MLNLRVENNQLKEEIRKLKEDIIPCQEAIAILERQRQRLVEDWERHHKELASASLSQIGAAQAAVAGGHSLPSCVSRFAQSLSSKGKANVSCDQEGPFEDDPIHDDEEPDVKSSRASSPRLQSIGPISPHPILPRFSTLHTPGPRQDLIPRFHQARSSQPPRPTHQPHRPICSPSPSLELGPRYRELHLRASECRLNMAPIPGPPAAPLEAKIAPPPKFNSVRKENLRVWIQ